MQDTRIEDLITAVLVKEFPGEHNKHKIYRAGNRLNFSCPYCGDSHDGRKKRGNFYLDTLSYKCYNGGCGIFKDVYSILKDFSLVGKLEQDEKTEILDILHNRKERRKTYYGDIDISIFFDEDIKNYIIPRAEFMERMGLEEAKGSKIEIYLTRRNQIPDQKFAWDKEKQRLYIFNLSRENNILGLQFRNMQQSGGGSKYYTYKLRESGRSCSAAKTISFWTDAERLIRSLPSSTLELSRSTIRSQSSKDQWTPSSGRTRSVSARSKTSFPLKWTTLDSGTTGIMQEERKLLNS